MRTVYLAGPMSKIEGWNYPAFHAAAERLRRQGYTVVNPAELHASPDTITWEEAMRVDIPALMACDAIALLPGWKESRCARLEAFVAQEVGIRVVCAETLESIGGAV
jgi:hypothetical protein